MGITKQLLLKYGFPRPCIMHVDTVGRSLYAVSSQSREEVTHMVDLEGKTPECSCENYTLSKNNRCKHVRRVLMLREAGVIK